MRPRISIIIPMYNAAQYIRRCVDSVVRSDSDGWELILVNDGSQDDTAAICEEIVKKHNNIVLVNKTNGGVSSARNTGIEAASGEWIAFVDADDIITANALHDYETAIESSPEIDYHTFDIHTVSADGKVSCYGYPEGKLSVRELISGMLRYEVCVGPVGKLFRKSIIDRHGLRFDPSLKMGEDFIFNLEYMVRAGGGCESHSSIVYEYLLNNESATFGRDNTLEYEKLNNVLESYVGNPYFDNADINFCIAMNIFSNVGMRRRFLTRKEADRLLSLDPVANHKKYITRYLAYLRIGRWLVNARLAAGYIKHWRKKPI